MYPLLRYCVERIVAPSGKISREVESFLACCTLVDIMEMETVMDMKQELMNIFLDFLMELIQQEPRLMVTIMETETVMDMEQELMKI